MCGFNALFNRNTHFVLNNFSFLPDGGVKLKVRRWPKFFQLIVKGKFMCAPNVMINHSIVVEIFECGLKCWTRKRTATNHPLGWKNPCIRLPAFRLKKLISLSIYTWAPTCCEGRRCVSVSHLYLSFNKEAVSPKEEARLWERVINILLA